MVIKKLTITWLYDKHFKMVKILLSTNFTFLWKITYFLKLLYLLKPFIFATKYSLPVLRVDKSALVSNIILLDPSCKENPDRQSIATLL